MRITVIVNLFNGAKHIGETLDSLLAQTRPADEILVVDDGSSDNSRDIVRGYSDDTIRLVERENGGLGAARTTAIENARGDWVSFLDHDDIAPETRLADLVTALQSVDGAVGAYGAWRNFLDPGLRTAGVAEDDALFRIQHKIWLCTGLTSVSLMRRHLPGRTDLGSVFDTSWMLNLMDSSPVLARTDRVVLERRIHDTNDSWNKNVAPIADLIVQRIRDKRRQGG